MALQRAGGQQRRVDHLLDAHSLAQLPRLNALLVGQSFIARPGAVYPPRLFPYGEEKRHGTETALMQQTFPVFLVPA